MRIMIKKFFSLCVAILCITWSEAYCQTNDFYDDAPLNHLTGSEQILLTGEIEKDIIIDLNTLPKRDVIVKETYLNGEKAAFTGSYRYEGYSLYDILNSVILKKKNAAEYPPIIDLYVEISNVAGEKVVLSWGELYYPNNRHNIIIATDVARIVPSKTKDLWPLPVERKLIVGNDLITERNISNPVKITVKSLYSTYKINKGMKPMWCDTLRVCVNGNLCMEYVALPEEGKEYTYNTVFYGRGMGIHGTSPFKGKLLGKFITPYYSLSKESLRTGIVVIAGVDGYHAAFSLSELVNRNDQQEILIIDKDNYENCGRFSLFPACDFFSDRAIKSVMEINLLVP